MLCNGDGNKRHQRCLRAFQEHGAQVRADVPGKRHSDPEVDGDEREPSPGDVCRRTPAGVQTVAAQTRAGSPASRIRRAPEAQGRDGEVPVCRVRVIASRRIPARQLPDPSERHMLQTTAVGHVEHYAGDQMYIDFAGDRLEVVDQMSGQARSVEVFVAILPCSHYTYCEAVWSQRKEDLIKACENALRFFGGVPMAIVPDNLRSAVTRSDRNEPVINDDFAAFAEHYGCAVCPARVRHPKDKALVENAVKLMYSSVYTDIEGLVFHNLEDLNKAIQHSLEVFNDRKLTGRNKSRRQLFDEVERDYLRPLPEMRYQLKERKSVTVMKNSYVTLERHHYSVPTDYIGKRVDIVYDSDILEIYHGLRLVTVHQRDDTPYAYTTKEAHNLPGRHGTYEQDLEEVYHRAADMDNIVLLYLKEVAAYKKYPPNAFRSCRGILSLEKKYGQDRLVAACACATQMRVYGYQDVVDILNRGDDAEFLPQADGSDEPEHTLPAHRNIRGKEYFIRNTNLKNENIENHGNK